MSRALITTSSVHAPDVSSMVELQIVGIKYRPSNNQLVYILLFLRYPCQSRLYLRHSNRRGSSASKDIGLAVASAGLPLGGAKSSPASLESFSDDICAANGVPPAVALQHPLPLTTLILNPILVESYQIKHPRWKLACEMAAAIHGHQ